jgi:hypothetical protein
MMPGRAPGAFRNRAGETSLPCDLELAVFPDSDRDSLSLAPSKGLLVSAQPGYKKAQGCARTARLELGGTVW